jgi:hypothetical protein
MSGRPWGRGATLPLVALLVPAALVIYTGLGVRSRTTDVAAKDALRYRVLLKDLDRVLARDSSEALVRAVPARTIVQHDRRRTADTLLYDSLVVTADPLEYPSFRRGGFLWTQVIAYNEFQRRRVALALSRPELFDSLARRNPSLFEVRRDASGMPVQVMRTSRAWNLEIPSPHNPEWRGPLVMRDYRRLWALVWRDRAVPLDTGGAISVDGRPRPCLFRAVTRGLSIHCDRPENAAQPQLRLWTPDAGGSWFAGRGYSTVYVDGAPVSSRDSALVRAGWTFDLAPLGTTALLRVDAGTISAPQWIDGRDTRVVPQDPVLQALSRLASTAADTTVRFSDDTLQLSLVAGLQHDLSKSVATFTAGRAEPRALHATVLLADARSGEILALSEAGPEDDPGLPNAFVPQWVGSTVKPINAAAILARQPALASLAIRPVTERVERILGYSVRPSFESRLCSGFGPPEGWVTLRYAITCSNNEFFATQLLLASAGKLPVLSAGAGGSSIRLGGNEIPQARARIRMRWGAVPRDSLLASPVNFGLHDLFDADVDPYTSGAAGRRSPEVWRGLAFVSGRGATAPVTLFPYRSTPFLLGDRDAPGTPPSLLARYAFGAWQNRWTLLELTQSYARLLTDRRVSLRLVPAHGASAPVVWDTLGLSSQPWYAELIGGLEDVTTVGTANRVHAAMTGDGLPPAIFAKTGTVRYTAAEQRRDPRTHRIRTDSTRIYAKALVFGLGERPADGRAALRCGIIAAIYVRFATEPPPGEALPPRQEEFARSELAGILRRYWPHLGVCPSGGNGAT